MVVCNAFLQLSGAGTRLCSIKGTTAMDTKVSMHFVFQILLTGVQFQQVWGLIDHYIKKQKFGSVLLDIIGNPQVKHPQ